MKKRKSYEIVENILNALEDGPKPFTRVLFLSYLTMKPFRRYIEKLEKRGLVRQTDGLLEITEEGRRVKEIIAKTASEIRHFKALEEECRKKKKEKEEELLLLLEGNKNVH